MTKIIAFAGRKQSGKTSCSNFVKTLFPDDENFVKVYNFADPLKQDVCMNLLGLTYEQCYGDDEQKNTLTDILWNEKLLTAREVMQLVGTDLFRAMKHDVWTSATIQKIQTEQKKIALIADCRFPNEVKAVKESGGVVIKLTRNPFNSDHLSETALDHENYDQRNFDTIITNHYMSIDNQNDVIYKYLRKKGLLSL
jgi:hypothetical protein